MAWVRLDDHFAEHPKVAQAGPLGMALYVAALCYCNRHMTDGFVPKQIASRLLDFSGLGMRMWDGEMVGGGMDAEWHLVVEDLVEAGLWEPVAGGWQVHDYLDYQPSKSQLQAVSEVRRKAGARGGAASRKQIAKQDAEHDAKQDTSNELSKREPNEEAKSKPVPGPVPVPESREDANASFVGSGADEECAKRANGEDGPPKSKLEPYREVWNEICGSAGLPSCRELNEPRRKSLKARLKEPLFRDDPLERWRNYCRRIVRDVGPDPGWSWGKPNIDWALKPSTPAKVHEGAYGKPEQRSRPPPPWSTL